MLLMPKDQVRIDQGQHTYTKANTQPPPSGTQIFCGNLPRNMYEIELFPYFALIGEIYEFRLMMEFSGFSRGFCFVTYMTEEVADQAVRNLHGYILKDQALYVYKSWDNTMLFIHGIPLWLSLESMSAELKKQFPGIINISCKKDDADASKHRGWAFLQFDCHRNASICRKQIWPRKLMSWGSMITVEWARPERENNCSLVLGNLPAEFTRTQVYSLLQSINDSTSLVQIYKKVGQTEATLVFNTALKANYALKVLKGTTCKGVPLVVYKKKQTDLSKNSPKAKNSSQSTSVGTTSSSSSDVANSSSGSSNTTTTLMVNRPNGSDSASISNGFHDNPFAFAFADPEYYDFKPEEQQRSNDFSVPLLEELNSIEDWHSYDECYNQIFSDDPNYRPTSHPNFNLAKQFQKAVKEIVDALF